MRLLVIEDEHRLSGILKSRLGDAGFVVDIAASAGDANAALEIINYDVAVLDLACLIVMGSPSSLRHAVLERPCQS
jgi:DNA-binding response OmpR family regulator